MNADEQRAAAWGLDAARNLSTLAGTMPAGSRWRATLYDLADAIGWATNTLNLGGPAFEPAPDGAAPDLLEVAD